MIFKRDDYAEIMQDKLNLVKSDFWQMNNVEGTRDDGQEK